MCQSLVAYQQCICPNVSNASVAALFKVEAKDGGMVGHHVACSQAVGQLVSLTFSAKSNDTIHKRCFWDGVVHCFEMSRTSHPLFCSEYCLV